RRFALSNMEVSGSSHLAARRTAMLHADSLRSALPALIAAAIALSAAPTSASVIHVPGDRPTIQQGINAANAGDTVLVSPGTYLERIDFIGKAIVVTSE